MLHEALQSVLKPGRYLGCEVNAVRKTQDDVRLRFALAFPDVYEVGFSHIGLHILYSVLNSRPEIWAERVYAPWPDMEAEMRRLDLPLYGLESKDPIRSFDIVGFSLQHELCATNVLQILDLAGIALHASDREDGDPLVIGGGPNATNPEPYAAFFDAFLLGEGEEAILEIADAVMAAKAEELPRADMVQKLAEIEGVYVPSLYDVKYNENGKLTEIKPKPGVPERIVRRVVSDLDTAAAVAKPLVPTVEPVHDRYAIEIQRGCSRGCRFCQAGMLYRPTRQRKPETIMSLARQGLSASGQQTLGLLSLSSSDYGCLSPVVSALFTEHQGEHVSVQLPSLRVETLDDSLVDILNRERKTGFTLAPETATERLRRVINKGNTEADLLSAIETVFKAGWKHIKLYFMIGLPTETDDDVREIAELGNKVRQIGRRIDKAIRVTVSVSTFVPKPHTPFQWCKSIGEADIRRKLEILREGLSKYKLGYKWHHPDSTLLEAALARGNRRLSDVIEKAYEGGARFDAWTDQFDIDLWRESFASCGMDFDEASQPAFEKDAVLPWMHLDTKVTTDYLWSEYEAALNQAARSDCAYGTCDNCGVCDHKQIRRDVYVPPEKEAKAHVQHAETPSLPNASTHKVTAPRTIRFQYEKGGYSVFMGHLDTMNQVASAFRRAGVRLKYSEGFHPKPKIAFSQALPLGVSSIVEFFDAELLDTLPVTSISERLARSLPHGMRIVDAREAVGKVASLSESVAEMTWKLDLSRIKSPEEVAQDVAGYAEAESVPIVRKGKKRDRDIEIKDFVSRLVALGESRVEAAIRTTMAGSLKPAELLAGVFGIEGAERFRVRIEKTAVRFGAPQTKKEKTKMKYIGKNRNRKEKVYGTKAHHQCRSAGDESGIDGKREHCRAVYRKET